MDEDDSGYSPPQEVTPNISLDQIFVNCRKNLAAGYKEWHPECYVSIRSSRLSEVVIVGGGPSLAETFGSLRLLQQAGLPIVAVNGTHDWLINNGIMPDMMVMVDGKPSAAKFTRNAVSSCNYLMASQCDPYTVDNLPKENVYIWRTSKVAGGSTVILCAIELLHQMEFKHFHLFGFDSCLIGDKHHAYQQKENDEACSIMIPVGERNFRCHTWMAIQAEEFLENKERWGHFTVYGDGLIANLIKED